MKYIPCLFPCLGNAEPVDMGSGSREATWKMACEVKAYKTRRMAVNWSWLCASLLLLICCVARDDGGFQLEKPQYTVVHSESDFEIRLYRETAWMSALVQEISFEKATLQGFHRLFQYIQGANLNSSRLPMTAPVLTSIVPGAGPFHSAGYIVRFYLPTKFQDSPPLPLPELKLQSNHWESHCIAVRKFSGFAKDRNIVKEAQYLAASLSKSPWANSSFDDAGKYAYSIAQYNSPFRIIGRVNEVWVNITGSVSEQCQPILDLLKEVKMSVKTQ